jgi:hypothetical protein
MRRVVYFVGSKGFAARLGLFEEGCGAMGERVGVGEELRFDSVLRDEKARL